MTIDFKSAAICLFTTASILLSACSQKADPYNSLTDEEKNQGWQLLFDGKTMKGWHAYNQTKMTPVWQVKDGALQCIQIPNNLEHADLITDSVYENFDLRFEWKIEKAGNSGVMINVQEDPKYAATFFTGPEYQILDNANDEVHRGKPAEISGAVYSVSPVKNPVEPKPFDEWNEGRIVQDNGKITFWLNGTETADILINSDEWNELVAKSSLHTYSDFGKLTKGHIALQDHIDDVAFRSIKIKKL